MTNYQCNACGRTFNHPAKQTLRLPSNSIGERDFLETYVCPFCNSKEYKEYTDPQPEVSNVHIYDLTSGPQTALDALLAQGYVIVNRYSKQYHLEKPKQTEATV